MFDFDVSMVQKFDFAQRAAYITPRLHLGFHVRGCRWYRAPGVEKTLSGPYLSLTAPGTPVEFEFDHTRENWVIQLETDQVRQARSAMEVQILHEGAWIDLPAFAHVPREHVAGWQGEFMRMREAFVDPHPRSRLRVRVGVANVLRYILDQMPDNLGETPAARLKRLISEDAGCKRSLEALSRDCGYSPDHLRKLFVREYGLTPLAYRNRQRMARAVSLLSNSDLSIKEIANATGFAHGSHFATMFRETFGMTPRQAIVRYRSGQ